MTELETFYQELDRHYASHDIPATEAFFRESLGKAQGRRDPAGGANMDYVCVCNEAACFFRGRSRYADALHWFGEAAGELERAGLRESANYGMVLLNRAGVWRMRKEPERALQDFREAERILKANHVRDPYVLASLGNNTALALEDAGDADGAERKLREALTALRDCQGAETEIASTYSNLAGLCARQGRLDEAQEACSTALEILKGQERTNSHYPMLLNTRAHLERQRGELDKAIADFRKVLELNRDVYGDNDDEAACCESLAACLEETGQAQEAASVREKAAAIRASLRAQRGQR